MNNFSFASGSGSVLLTKNVTNSIIYNVVFALIDADVNLCYDYINGEVA